MDFVFISDLNEDQLVEMIINFCESSGISNSVCNKKIDKYAKDNENIIRKLAFKIKNKDVYKHLKQYMSDELKGLVKMMQVDPSDIVDDGNDFLTINGITAGQIYTSSSHLHYNTEGLTWLSPACRQELNDNFDEGSMKCFNRNDAYCSETDNQIYIRDNTPGVWNIIRPVIDDKDWKPTNISTLI